ncbi:heme NO-binding domain-containing protein [Puniceicoccaceae bacterium K14]|nr:heme NO-binding domain-containing protein [Puniceicoccaceae bacterium K14]
MKGIVFTEFLEMVEKEFGFEVVDKITSITNLHGQGAYTAVGNYPHSDILAMVGKLSESVGLSPSDLTLTFGRYLFKTFSREYKDFFQNVNSSKDFLFGIETVIHSEVRKLYPDALLPSFECEVLSDGSLVMDYHSIRPFADLAEGLILECIEHFKDGRSLERIEGKTEDAHSARFIIKPSQ